MKELSRREVLKGTAATAVALAVGKTSADASPLLTASRNQPARSETGRRLKLAIIGCGGKGWSGMQDAAQFGDVLAIADCDADNRSRAMLEHPRSNTYVDYREMLQAVRGEVDSVVISSPDHHHFLASALAMNMGMHVFCEKPLTRSIWESRELARIARRRRVATQMGNQSTANTPMRKAAAAVKSGAFGAVKEIHLWTNRAAAYWQQGLDRPSPSQPSKKLDFDVWLGPSPERPFAQGYHPFAWRGWWDFGTGALGDMGCHIFNMPFMALDLRDPIAVQAQTSGHNRDSFPVWSIVHFEFPQRGQRPALDLYWYDGGKKPPASLIPGFEVGGNGSIVVCERATVFSPDEGNWTYHVIGGTMPDLPVDESPGHMAEFARAALGGPAAVSNFPDYAGPLTETVLLGNLAIWADGPRLEWDARRTRVRGTNEFDALIRPTYRPGWSL